MAIITINREKILNDYPSISSFIKDYGLTNPAFYAIVNKKTFGFNEGSKSFKVFKKMEAGGYVSRDNAVLSA